MKFELEIGDVIEQKFPFLSSHKDYDGEGGGLSWRPYVDLEFQGPEGEYAKAFCHGWGDRIITIVSKHKPGKYPERVFFTRQWRSPTGKVFGKTTCRITTSATLRRWLRDGYSSLLYGHKCTVETR